MAEKDETIVPVSIENEMRTSYMEYAMSVIVGRAIPDVRDGLKPVHRRVVYAQKELNNRHNRPYLKSARLAGDVVGKYHPHGESAVYDTIVRMAQPFAMRYVLVDGQGNFGSVDGDPPAAMRYTEVRMSKLSEQLLVDLDSDTVDFAPNYDTSLTEPRVMPAQFPNLLINGGTGIAVGMATNIPPHNLAETLNAFLRYIDDPQNCSIASLMELMPGPDFPTGGVILGSEGIYKAYSTGRGIIRIRGVANTEQISKKKEAIVITELPYAVNKVRLVEQIAQLVKDKSLEGITDLRDETSRRGTRIVIELRSDANPDVIINQLYKHTNLQTSMSIILLAICDGEPVILNLPTFFGYFLNHRIEIIERRSRFELKRAQNRAHILEGYRIALDNIEPVIELIKSAQNSAAAQQQLISRYGLSTVQCKEVLEMRLSRLTGLEQEKIRTEHQKLLERITELETILADRHKVIEVIRQESQQIIDDYSDERLTKIEIDVEELEAEDLIVEEDVVVTISHSGYIKRSQLALYKTQHRGGRGVQGMSTREEDFVNSLFVASTHAELLIFTSLGKVYKKKVFKLPAPGRSGRGKSIVNLLPLEQNETICAYLPIKSFNSEDCICMFTEKGIVKKTSLNNYANPRSTGLIALKIDPDDKLIGAKLVKANDHIFLVTQQGLALRFKSEELRPIGRNARGVMGIRLQPNDKVICAEVVDDTPAELLTITENGYGKRTKLDLYPLFHRASRGVITIQTTKRNGPTIGALKVKQDDEIMAITQNGKIIRINVKGVPSISRNTQGVKIIQLNTGESVASITGCPPEETLE